MESWRLYCIPCPQKTSLQSEVSGIGKKEVWLTPLPGQLYTQDPSPVWSVLRGTGRSCSFLPSYLPHSQRGNLLLQNRINSERRLSNTSCTHAFLWWGLHETGFIFSWKFSHSYCICTTVAWCEFSGANKSGALNGDARSPHLWVLIISVNDLVQEEVQNFAQNFGPHSLPS